MKNIFYKVYFEDGLFINTSESSLERACIVAMAQRIAKKKKTLINSVVDEFGHHYLIDIEFKVR